MSERTSAFSKAWTLSAVVVFALTTASTLRAAETDAGPAPRVAVATHVQWAARGDLTRLSFDLSGPTTVRAFVLAAPDRVVIEVSNVDFEIDPDAGRRPVAAGGRRRRTAAVAPLAGAIASFRAGLFAPGKSRVVIDLAEPVRIARVAAEPLQGGASQLVIELARTDRAAFAAAAKQASLAAAASPPPSAIPETGGAKPIVVLDAGHGGVDDGARGPSGVLEKDIVLAFTRALRARLESENRYRIVLTRDDDVFIPLGDRVKIAHDAGASLFLSIHADMLADEPQVSGATAYTLSDKASDAQAARVAAKENESDLAAGLDGLDDHSEVADILFDLTRRETRAYSHVFARTLVGYLKDVAALNKNARRSAGFRVLKASDTPSVLLELGYLSSDKDTHNLTSPEWREHASIAVARAIDGFFDHRDATAAQPAPSIDASATAAYKPGLDEGRREPSHDVR